MSLYEQVKVSFDQAKAAVSELRDGNPVLIYGAGESAVKITGIFEKFNINISEFFVSNGYQNDPLNIVDPISFSDACSRYPSFHVFIERGEVGAAKKHLEKTLIKMDIVGAEVEALKGAIKTIQKYHPKLTICIYHKGSHLFEVPQLIKSKNEGYKLYIKHQGRNDLKLYVMLFKAPLWPIGQLSLRQIRLNWAGERIMMFWGYSFCRKLNF